MAEEHTPGDLENPRSRLRVRNATRRDIPAIAALSARVYAGSGMQGYSEGLLTGQINNFPDGQFVAVVDDQVVGYCATFRVSEALGLQPHTWAEITGNGYASRHDPDGDWLYGMEVCVDPDYRGYRIGQRLYNERKKLCEDARTQGHRVRRTPADAGPAHQEIRHRGGLRRAGDAEEAARSGAVLPVAQRLRGDRHHPALPRCSTSSRWATASTWCGAIPR